MKNSFYMHPKYQEFLGSIKNLESDSRITPNSLNLAFDVWLLAGENMGESQIEWLKAENARLTKENEQLMKDVHRIDSARQAAVSQCAAMADNQTVKDYAIWQAITDLESRCRHRSSGLQIEVEDKEHEPVVQAALLILAECSVDVVRDAKFPNIKINYDRSQNQFFGKSQ